MITEKEREQTLISARDNNLLQAIDKGKLQQIRHLQDEIVNLALDERKRLESELHLSRSKIDVSQQYLGFATPNTANAQPTQTNTTYEAD